MINLGILMKKIFLILLIIVFSFSSNWIFAQEGEYNYNEQSGVHHRHHIGLFVGGTSSLDYGTAHFTAGLDYEFKFLETKPIFGLGLLRLCRLLLP